MAAASACYQSAGSTQLSAKLEQSEHHVMHQPSAAAAYSYLWTLTCCSKSGSSSRLAMQFSSRPDSRPAATDAADSRLALMSTELQVLRPCST